MKRILAIITCAGLLALPCVAAAVQPAPKHTPKHAQQPQRQQQSPTNQHRWQQMTPRQRTHVQQRAQEFKRMDPKQRQDVRKAYRYYHSLPAREREHLREQWQQNPRPERQDKRDIGPTTTRSSHGHQRGASLNQPLYTPPSMGVTGRRPGERSPLIQAPNPRSKPDQR